MLLVMNTTNLFESDQSFTGITKDRIQSFLPSLWDEVFKISTPVPISSPTTEVITSVSIRANIFE
jgi:hypothetical protein